MVFLSLRRGFDHAYVKTIGQDDAGGMTGRLISKIMPRNSFHT